MTDSATFGVDVAAYSPGFVQQVADDLRGAGLPLSTHSNAYANALQVKSGAGILFGFTVYNSNASAQFIQVHDSATLPADGAVPVAVLTAQATDNLAVSYIFPGRFFQRGIWLCNSSTGPTKTIGSADCFFDAQYV